MVALPLAEILVRQISPGGIPGSVAIVQRLTLWVGFLGAALAAREGRLISLATATFVPEGRWRTTTQLFSAVVGSAVSTILAFAAVELVVLEADIGTEITTGLPEWVAQLALPASFGLIALRLVWRAGRWPVRLVAASGLVLGYWLSGSYAVLDGLPAWPWLVLVVAAAAAGAPVFTILGGAGVFLYMTIGVQPAVAIVKTYELTTQAHLPAIPLFTLTGFLLAAGHASERLLRVFRAWVGWFPGGTAVVATVLCAFFTVFTGGSGVTILALGGLLLPALLEDGYRERFSIGMLTASGSLGLLWPPALPLILYAIVAEQAPVDLFVGGLLPGLLLLGLVAAWGIREGVVTGAGRHRFERREAIAALRAAKWELLLPVVALGTLFSGYATMVESAAVVALYAFVIQCFVHRDVTLGAGVRKAFVDCVVLIGGVLIILGVAVGFTSYLVDAEIPGRLLAWTQANVESPLLFLLGLNICLLIVGCLMDIFSAIAVVVPLIIPIGQAFGIDPVHLGVIFVANLELGYLTPPVGLNLFLASYRFDRPLLQVYRASVPLLLILGAGVLVITYVPWLTTGLLNWLVER